MPDTGSNFSVAITATDAYSEAFKGFVKNVRGHFGEVEKAGKETSAKLGELFEGCGKFAGIGGLGGGLRGGAFYLLGGPSQSGAAGIETLSQKLHGAAWGRDQQAIAVLKEFGIAVKD